MITATPNFVNALCSIKSNNYVNKSIYTLGMYYLENGTKPFYANDLGLSGGSISGLLLQGVIKKTGNTHSYWVEIDDETAKKVTVSEWEIVDSEWFHLYFNRCVSELDKILEPFGMKVLG